jgi:phosphatidylglycerophosphatase A
VLDEICGMLVAGVLITPTVRTLTAAFLVFRLLDIVKPFPAGYLDRRLKNGVGVVGDDLVAGLYTNLLIRAFV